jgi:tetratricopeptide (TPR) repeat protein
MLRISLKLICRIFCLLIFFIILGIFSRDYTYAKSDDKAFYGKLVHAGNLFLKYGNYREALREFQKAEEQSPVDGDVLIGLARSYSRLGMYDDAHEKLNLFRKKYPFDMRYHLVNGEILSIKGHTEEASEQFVILVEKGIYRFEALQALIRLYADSGNEKLISIIENAIPLYEPENQAVLYDLLRDRLSAYGKTEEAEKYAKLHDNLIADRTNPDESPMSDSYPDELKAAISEAESLIECGSYRAAENFIADAARKWPSETRFHDLLKECYLRMMEDEPIVTGAISGGGGLSGLMPDYSNSTEKMRKQISENATLRPEVSSYLTKVMDVSSETEKYFYKAMNKFVELDKRVRGDFTKPLTCQQKSQIFKQHLKEFQTLVSDCATVLDREIDVMKGITPPENFKEFHSYHIETSILYKTVFSKLEEYAKTGNEKTYSEILEMINTGNLRTDRQTVIFTEALDKESEEKPAA